MARNYMALPIIQITKGAEFARPQQIPEFLHMGDPALSAMIDLNYSKPLIMSGEKRMYDARVSMLGHNNLHICLVTNDDNKLIGFLSLQKILTEFPILHIEQNKVKRKQVLIKHVMRPIEEVAALCFEDLGFAKVGDIVKTLETEKQNYVIALEQDNDTLQPMVRGIFLASLMNQQLGIDVVSQMPDKAESIAELAKVLSS